jgi:hypothetical protein
LTRAFKWALAGLGITLASAAIFVLAAALFPGDPGRFYLLLGLVMLGATLIVRLLGYGPQPGEGD